MGSETDVVATVRMTQHAPILQYSLECDTLPPRTALDYTTMLVTPTAAISRHLVQTQHSATPFASFRRLHSLLLPPSLP
jgi:hypothetical protein